MSHSLQYINKSRQAQTDQSNVSSHMTYSQWAPPPHQQYDTRMCSVGRGPAYWDRYECSGTLLAKCNVHCGTQVCHTLSIIEREGGGGGEERGGGGERRGRREVMGMEERGV